MDETPAALLASLADTVRRLTELRPHTETRWRLRPDDGGWSALETLAHLRSADDIFRPRVFQILARDEPLLIDLDERRWQEVAGYTQRRPADVLAGLVLLRRELVQALQRVPDADWQRAGVHELRGRLTLQALIARWSAHEREHLAQLEHAFGELL